jgi:flagellar hook-associated protein 1 FlgK
MSLSSSMHTAVAGLSLASRRAEIVAQNVANADRPGYARRTLVTASGIDGLPPNATRVHREVDPRLTQLRREAESQLAGGAVAQSFQTRLDGEIGDPDQAGSLQDRIARLDAALVAATARPGSDPALSEVVQSADDLVDKLRTLDGLVRQERQSADARIGAEVEQINADLQDVARLNARIMRFSAGGEPTADLLDQRSVLIDRISESIPLRELPRAGGAIALVSEGGYMLLDGRATTLGFSGRSPITPAMKYEDNPTVPNHLSGLTINGEDVPVHGGMSGIRGGSLHALFNLRDHVAPEATARLDGLAAELIDRFANPANPAEEQIDESLPAGAFGLFSDSAGALTAPIEQGLAGRLTFALDVDDPTEHWRVRDGLAAVAPDPTGASGTLDRLSAALTDVRPPVASALGGTSGSVAELAAQLKSAVSFDRVRADEVHSRASTEAGELSARRDGGAVDMDNEMRRLIEIEQAYAANARLIQVAGDMMDRLMEL